MLRLHSLLKLVSPLYADVDNNAEFRGVDDPDSVYCTRMSGTEATDDLVAQARARQQSVAEPSDTDDPTVRETTVVQSETVLIETAIDAEEEARLARAFDSITGNKQTFVARRSTSILQQNDPFYMERLFPHLLTFGIGGFMGTRRHRYSKRDVVLHYFNLSTNRFAEDPLFKVQMFDFLSALRVKDGVFVRVRHDPDVATRMMKISPEQLRKAMETRARKRYAARSERRFEQTEADRRGASILKSINASTAKMWSSNEKREAFQRKVDAMAIMYGEPSIFWMLTSSPDTSIAAAFWTGYDLPNGRPKDLAACTVVNMPCSSEMKRLVMQNTVVQAHYYKLCCRVLIDVMFGWDSSANKPKAEPGIFGFVEALFYALEQQGRLRVHHHGVAWIAGLPKTRAGLNKLLASDSMRGKFEAYCASLFAAKLPVFESLQTISCPKPGCNGQLNPLAIHGKYKRLLNLGTPPPKVAACNACTSEFTDAEVVASVIDFKSAELDAENREVSTEDAVRAIRTRFGGLSADKPTANVQLSRLLLKDQVHAYEHTHLCVKSRSGTECRYHFYRDLQDVTRLTADQEMAYRRSIGNQWLNTYVPIWRRLLHFNMDARILWSGHSLQAIRYAMQSASKRQSVLDNASVVEMALRRRIQREATSAADKTEFQKGVARLMALAFSSSGGDGNWRTSCDDDPPRRGSGQIQLQVRASGTSRRPEYDGRTRCGSCCSFTRQTALHRHVYSEVHHQTKLFGGLQLVRLLRMVQSWRNKVHYDPSGLRVCLGRSD